MSEKNNFKILLEEEERRFEASGLREEIDRKLNQRFAFLRLLGDLTELFTVRLIDIIIMMSDENIDPGLYFTPALKSDLEAALDQMIDRNINQAFAQLKELIDQKSEKYPYVLALEAELSQSTGASNREEKNIDSRLKELISSLRPKDLR